MASYIEFCRAPMMRFLLTITMMNLFFAGCSQYGDIEHVDLDSTNKLKQQWHTKGFEAFRQGTFGNAGHNLYVSKAGILQRIHQFDLDKNGCFDLVMCNSQDHKEQVPSYVYTNPLGKSSRTELPADGAMAGWESKTLSITYLCQKVIIS